jgi:GH24 family phage-related lysozyme (muramidase)
MKGSRASAIICTGLAAIPGPRWAPGYDMRDRSRAEVEQKLRSIDLDARTAADTAAGAGLQGNAAKTFAHDNKNIVNLTEDQQDRFLQVNLPHYESMVHRGIKVVLTQDEFNALVSFVYNLGQGWPGVRATSNSGDKAKAAKIIEEQVRSRGKLMNGLVKRRHDEAMLLLKGQYK